MSNPFFTIATITYNSGNWIRQTIESVLASSFENFELVISDDGSSDDTLEIIRQFSDPRIKISVNKVNIGEYPNRNKVLNCATGEYIFFVDGDDVLYHDSLERIFRYLTAFPDAGALYGVHTHPFDFVIFPYQFAPAETCRLLYQSLLPISIVGFAETVFKVSALKDAGGLSEKFVIGDTYIKRKLACMVPVVLVPMGFSFWRQTEGQATKRAAINYLSMKENFYIDREILNAGYFPAEPPIKNILLRNFKIRTAKLLVKNTVLKGDIISFIKIFREFSLSLSDLQFLFIKGDYSYRCNADGATPLKNSYNFTKDI